MVSAFASKSQGGRYLPGGRCPPQTLPLTALPRPFLANLDFPKIKIFLKFQIWENPRFLNPIMIILKYRIDSKNGLPRQDNKVSRSFVWVRKPHKWDVPKLDCLIKS